MRQPRRPELGQREDRSPPRLCQRNLTLQSILTIGSKTGHLHSLHRCRNCPCALQVLDWMEATGVAPAGESIARVRQNSADITKNTLGEFVSDGMPMRNRRQHATYQDHAS